MEFVDGLTLRQMMREGRMKPEEALVIVPRICEALQFAHEQGVVHRDIKPENVLLDKQGRVKIADFGIAKLMGGAPLPVGEGQAVPKAGEWVGLTQDQVLGTPHYMAPEQVEHPQTVDHRADIYSLGVVFYEMLTGELPLGKFQPPSKKVQMDVRLDEIVLRALEKHPELRYQQVSEVRTCVETIAATPDAGSSRRQEAQTESVGDGASPGRSASAAATGMKSWTSFCFATSVAGVLLIGSLCGLLFRQVSGGWLMGTFILLACASAMLAFVLERSATAETQRVWFKAGAWLAFITALPVAGFGVFFLNALLSERGGWHPNPAEAVIVPLVWLGALLLPVCGWLLLRAARQPLGGAWKVAVVTVVVVILAFIVSYFQKAQKRQQAEQQREMKAAQEIAHALPQLRSEDVEQRRSAAMRLFSLRTGAKGAVPELLQALNDSDGLVRMFAASALGHIGTNAGPAAASELSRALEDPDQRVRFSAAEALGSVDLQTTANLAVLIDRLTNRPSEDAASWPEQRREAVVALAKMGARALPALPALHAIENEPEVNSHVNVKGAIAQIEHWAKRFDGRLLVPPGNAHFRPVVERALLAKAPMKTVDGLNFKTGKVVSTLEFENTSDTSTAKWLAEHRIDLAVVAAGWTNVWAFGSRQIQISRVPDDWWNSTTHDALLGALAKHELKVANGFPLMPFDSRSTPPLTFVFQTGDGTIGLLQITSVKATGEPPGLELRYKLLPELKPSSGMAGERSELGMSFGPVIERVVNDLDDKQGNQALNLKTGQLLSLPAAIGSWPDPALQEWLNTNAVDLLADFARERWALIGRGMQFGDLADEGWRTGSLAEMERVLRNGTRRLEARTNRSGSFYLLPTNVLPPMTFAFQTSSGKRGVLQIAGFAENPRGVKIRYKLVQTKPTASAGSRNPEPSHRKFVRLVVDKAALTFEGQPTTWDDVGTLLEKVPERKNTVLECAVTSDRITVQQQNEWFGKCIALAHGLGFEYASFIGIQPLGSKGTTPSTVPTEAGPLPGTPPAFSFALGGKAVGLRRLILLRKTAHECK
jgi:hypothetical protein